MECVVNINDISMAKFYIKAVESICGIKWENTVGVASLWDLKGYW